EVRALQTGLVELGWYEGEVTGGVGTRTVRVDGQGNGLTAPEAGKSEPVSNSQFSEQDRQLPVQGKRFHRLQPGDVLWPGQVLATVRGGLTQGVLHVPSTGHAGWRLKCGLRRWKRSIRVMWSPPSFQPTR